MRRAIPPGLLGVLIVAAGLRAQAPPSPAAPPPAEVRAAFLRMLDRPRVPLDVRAAGPKEVAPGIVSEKVDFATERHQDGTIERVPALVVRPSGARPGARLPAVIVLHGTGGRKEGGWNWLEPLARRGFVAIAIDGRYHGERAGVVVGTKAYTDAIIRAWRSKPGEPQAHPLYYDTCWDIWRTLDYLQSRADVDPDRIGMVGTSKGGIETWLAAAVDDRVKAAVPAIAVQGFRWGLDHDRYQARANTVRAAHEAAAADLDAAKVDREVCLALWGKVLPGITDRFDCPSMLRLFAGRSLLILNGELDPNCPIEGAEVAIAAARSAFHEAGGDDRLQVMIARGVGHTVTPEQHEAALGWLVARLRPSPD